MEKLLKFKLLFLILMIISFVFLLNAQYAYGQPINFTLDFETGDLRGWTKTGKAFDYQPTLDDNPTARHRGQPSGHQGRYWIGTYEKYQGKPNQEPGDIQGDEHLGTLTSAPFTIPQGTLTFLIGGGSSFKTRVELLVQDPVEGDISVFHASGRNTETMHRVEWNLAPYAGKTGKIRIVDESSQRWGHINVDDFRFSSIPVTEKPRAKINPAHLSVTQGEKAVFESQSTPEGLIREKWRGPRGQTGEGRNFEVRTDRLDPGNYDITLNIIDKHEQHDKAMATLEIIPRAVEYKVNISADKDKIEQGQRVRFMAYINPELHGVKYRFSFGDGLISNWEEESEIEHAYSSPGVYKAFVDVRRGERIIAESTTIQIKVTPVEITTIDHRVFLVAEPNRTKPRQTVIFRARLEPYKEGAEYRFVFDDGSFRDWSYESLAEHSYSKPGNYHIRVIAKIGQKISESNPVLINIEEPSKEIPWKWIIPGVLAGFAGGYLLKKTLSSKVPVVHLIPQKDTGIQQIESETPVLSGLEICLMPVLDKGKQDIEAKFSLIDERREHE